jgi:hypothetical protein
MNGVFPGARRPRVPPERLAGAGTASGAETAIQQGIDVAHRQNAQSWELRGATSLAPLRRQQGGAKRRWPCSPPPSAGSQKASTPPI